MDRSWFGDSGPSFNWRWAGVNTLVVCAVFFVAFVAMNR